MGDCFELGSLMSPVRLSYVVLISGDCLKKSTGFLSSAVVVGLLTDGSRSGPNLVNALTLAKETGLEVRSS